MTTPTDLLDLATTVAREAAALVRARGGSGVEVAATKSSALDIVTQVDRDSEQLVRDRIGAARPDDGFVGEEGHDVAGSSGVRWVVDPIDGTVNFLYGLPQYAVSVAAERDGTTVAGIVLNVATGAEYTAVRLDDGRIEALRDGRPLRVREPAALDRMLVATGFHYTARIRAGQVEAVARLLPRIRDIRRLGSCALDLCAVAEGTVDAYVEEGVNVWDHAAGALVAEGAGASVELMTGAGGGALLVCAPAAGFGTLRDAVVDAGFAAGERS